MKFLYCKDLLKERTIYRRMRSTAYFANFYIKKYYAHNDMYDIAQKSL